MTHRDSLKNDPGTDKAIDHADKEAFFVFPTSPYTFTSLISTIMDFLTTFPYWGILLIVLANALIVARMDIRINEQEHD
ncbi:MAG: hypothetical protein AAF587_30225 [Bacteroidota bacterium]